MTIREVLVAVEGHGKYHTSAYDGPVLSVPDAEAQLLSLIQSGVEERIIGEVEQPFSKEIPLGESALVFQKYSRDQLRTEQTQALHQWIKELRGEQ